MVLNELRDLAAALDLHTSSDGCSGRANDFPLPVPMPCHRIVAILGDPRRGADDAIALGWSQKPTNSLGSLRKMQNLPTQ